MVKRLLKIVSFFAIVGIAIAIYAYNKVISPKILADNTSSVFIEIPSGSSFDDVSNQFISLGLIEDKTTFQLLAQKMNYQRDPMRAGRFEIKPGSTLIDAIRLLRNGKQSPVQVILTTEREPMNVAAKAARFIETDSLSIVQLFENQLFLDSIGYTKESLMSLFIPNTYEFFWNTSATGFVNRMIKEHRFFWDKEDRRAKAKKMGLTLNEVYTLASIVEKETLRNAEKRRMAGVYYNRIKKGMLLQADPTAVFATRDFNTTRVLNRHLEVDSPYNTYKYVGLPPGPITMSSISSIDAVLNHENHDYIFFCAKGDGSGFHNFAKTNAAHERNAAIYRQNLKKRGKR